MSKHRLRLSVIFAIILFAVSFRPQGVSAKVISTDETITIGVNETVDDDLFAAGTEINIEGTVNGDLYAGGGTINIKGTVNGDVIAAGGTVNVSGSVKEDLRLFAGFVTLSKATIGDNISVGSGSLSLDSETQVGGTVMAGCGTFDSTAQIGRNLLVGAGITTINGSIGKSVYAAGENVTLGSKTDIKGDFNYLAENEASIHADSSIGGTTKRYIPEAARRVELGDWRGWARRAALSFRIISYLSALLVGFLLIRFFPDTTEKIVKNISEKPWASLGWGLVVFFTALPVMFLLVITVIGLPLVFILGMALALELYLAKIFLGVLLGSMLADLLNLGETNPYLRFTLGLAVYYILTMIPIVNFFTATAAILFGLGSFLIYKKETLFS